jgi:hypothetical protein
MCHTIVQKEVVVEKVRWQFRSLTYVHGDRLTALLLQHIHDSLISEVLKLSSLNPYLKSFGQ